MSDAHGQAGGEQSVDATRAVERAGPWTNIANEFAEVFCRRVETRNGMRLEITSPRMGTTIRLDALELESLTWQTPEVFSEFLENPFGAT